MSIINFNFFKSISINFILWLLMVQVLYIELDWIKYKFTVYTRNTVLKYACNNYYFLVEYQVDFLYVLI